MLLELVVISMIPYYATRNATFNRYVYCLICGSLRVRENQRIYWGFRSGGLPRKMWGGRFLGLGRVKVNVGVALDWSCWVLGLKTCSHDIEWLTYFMILIWLSLSINLNVNQIDNLLRMLCWKTAFRAIYYFFYLIWIFFNNLQIPYINMCLFLQDWWVKALSFLDCRLTSYCGSIYLCWRYYSIDSNKTINTLTNTMNNILWTWIILTCLRSLNPLKFFIFTLFICFILKILLCFFRNSWWLNLRSLDTQEILKILFCFMMCWNKNR